MVAAVDPLAFASDFVVIDEDFNDIGAVFIEYVEQEEDEEAGDGNGKF